MDSIKQAVTHTLEIKKSTFITYLRPAAFMKDIEHALKEIRSAHPDASHHCVAYVLGDGAEMQKFDDDGEPAHTAGKPMIEVLKKNQLTNVLCVVVRYFGGVKLGAGGLVRAYTKATSEAVKRAQRTQKRAMVTLHIRVDFAASGAVERALRERAVIVETVYTDSVLYVVNVPEKSAPAVDAHVRDLTRGDAHIETIRHFATYA